MNNLKTHIFIMALFVSVYPGLANADEPADEPQPISQLRGGPYIGFSPYTGIIGAELQKGTFGVTVGLPECIGLKYYLDERGYGWFVGIHAMHYSMDDEETIDGIKYEDMTLTEAGLGFGYKWRWWDHWDLTASLSVIYEREKRTGAYAERTEESIYPFPGLSFGYSF